MPGARKEESFMPFCASCGTQAEGTFCPKCGAPVGAGAAPPPGAGVPPPVVGSAPMADNAASALCYLLIPAIVFLVIAPYNQNKTVRFNEIGRASCRERG